MPPWAFLSSAFWTQGAASPPKQELTIHRTGGSKMQSLPPRDEHKKKKKKHHLINQSHNNTNLKKKKKGKFAVSFHVGFWVCFFKGKKPKMYHSIAVVK